MCSRPRKPQRKPKPSAADVSGSKKNDASFRRSFSSASRSSAYFEPSTGIEPGEDHRLQFLEARKRRRRRAAPVSVIVSPIFASATFLMFATMKPASPTPSRVDRHRLGREHAELLDLEVLPRLHQLGSSGRAACTPSMTRVRMTTPRYGVVPRVEDQRLERRVGIARRRRQAMDDRFEDLVDAACLPWRSRGSRRSRRGR